MLYTNRNQRKKPLCFSDPFKLVWVNMSHMILTHQLARCFFTFCFLLFRVETSCCHSGRTVASSHVPTTSFTSLFPDSDNCSTGGRDNRCMFCIWTPKDDARWRTSVFDSISRLKKSRFTKSWTHDHYTTIILLGEQKPVYLHASKNISFALSRNHVRPNWSVWNISWTTHSKSLLAPKPKRKATVCIRNLQWVVFNQNFWYSFSIPWNRPVDIILILKEATSNYLRNVIDQRWTTFLQEIIELKLQQNNQVSP